MLIKEFRVTLPMTVDEYQIGQLYAVAEASKNETGGGEGVEVLENRPVEATEDHGAGQYTHKVYHLATKVPGWVSMLAPKGSLEIHEEAWNCYPYCKTVLKNPDYMKENFHITIETWHKEGRGELENVHNLPANTLKDREVVVIDIASPFYDKNAKEGEDPATFHSEVTGRGPLESDWMKQCEPVMTCYKKVEVEFKWWGLQGKMERYIHKVERQIFQKFHRQLFCWIDKWHGLTMEDIRRIEDDTKRELDEVTLTRCALSAVFTGALRRLSGGLARQISLSSSRAFSKRMRTQIPSFLLRSTGACQSQRESCSTLRPSCTQIRSPVRACAQSPLEHLKEADQLVFYHGW